MTMTILYHESCDVLCGIFEYGLTIERQVPEIRIHRARAGSSVPQLGLVLGSLEYSLLLYASNCKVRTVGDNTKAVASQAHIRGAGRAGGGQGVIAGCS